MADAAGDESEEPAAVWRYAMARRAHVVIRLRHHHADGAYVFPHGLAPVEVRDGTGRYWEPSIWMRHPVPGR